MSAWDDPAAHIRGLERRLAAIEALRDEWDEEALQAWRDADRIHAGDVIADQISRRAERLRAALETP